MALPGGTTVRPALGVGQRPHPVHRPGQRELRPAESLDEVAAAALAGLLHGAQYRVHRGEAARDPLGGHRAPGQHAVPLEQRQRERVRPHRLGRDFGTVSLGGTAAGQQ